MVDLSLAIHVLHYAAKPMKWRIPAKGFIRVMQINGGHRLNLTWLQAFNRLPAENVAAAALVRFAAS